MAHFMAAFARSRCLYLQMSSLRMEIRVVTQELEATFDRERRAALMLRRTLLETEWDALLVEHMAAVREGVTDVERLSERLPRY